MMLLPSNQLCDWPPSSRNLATGDLHTNRTNQQPVWDGPQEFEGLAFCQCSEMAALHLGIYI